MMERHREAGIWIGVPSAIGVALAGCFVGHAVRDARDRGPERDGQGVRGAGGPGQSRRSGRRVQRHGGRPRDAPSRRERERREGARVSRADSRRGDLGPSRGSRPGGAGIDPGRAPLDRYVAETVVTLRTGEDRTPCARRWPGRASWVAGRRADPQLRVQHPVLFIRSDKTKPEMIAEATRDARRPPSSSRRTRAARRRHPQRPAGPVLGRGPATRSRPRSRR